VNFHVALNKLNASLNEDSVLGNLFSVVFSATENEAEKSSSSLMSCSSLSPTAKIRKGYSPIKT